jgi:hypothetical protein
MFKPKLPCLPLIEERAKNVLKKEIIKEYKTLDENTPKHIYDAFKHPNFDFIMFPQVWGSTALGFNTIGGQALTKAYTVIAHEIYANIALVFFGEEFAYLIKNPNELFKEDLENRNMKAVYESFKYNNTDPKVYKLGEDKK